MRMDKQLTDFGAVNDQMGHMLQEEHFSQEIIKNYNFIFQKRKEISFTSLLFFPDKCFMDPYNPIHQSQAPHFYDHLLDKGIFKSFFFFFYL